LLSALGRELPEASWSTPAGGYFLWLYLPAGVSAGEALAVGEEAGVTFVAGEDFFVRPEDGADAVRLAFSFASPEEIGEGVARLAGALAGATA
jgi:DNA-binding transcriptional MocR family regulator